MTHPTDATIAALYRRNTHPSDIAHDHDLAVADVVAALARQGITVEPSTIYVIDRMWKTDDEDERRHRIWERQRRAARETLCSLEKLKASAA